MGNEKNGQMLGSISLVKGIAVMGGCDLLSSVNYLFDSNKRDLTSEQYRIIEVPSLAMFFNLLDNYQKKIAAFVASVDDTSINLEEKILSKLHSREDDYSTLPVIAVSKSKALLKLYQNRSFEDFYNVSWFHQQESFDFFAFSEILKKAINDAKSNELVV